MAKLFLLFTITMMVCVSLSADVSVRGYYRKDGTYVRPHMRSSPDSNFYNNWSTAGNVNPYTGRIGTKTTPSYSSNYGYTESQNYSNQSQNYKNVPSGGYGAEYQIAKKPMTVQLRKSPSFGYVSNQAYTSSNMRVNGIQWNFLGQNSSDAMYVAQAKREYSSDGLPVVAAMYTGVMKSNGRPTWLGKRFVKVKVNCYSNKLAVVADAIVNSSGNVVKDVVLTDSDELTWYQVSELFNQSKFYSAAEICM